eukprot:7145670-Karenia_brevis.AAC.1
MAIPNALALACFSFRSAETSTSKTRVCNVIFLESCAVSLSVGYTVGLISAGPFLHGIIAFPVPPGLTVP